MRVFDNFAQRTTLVPIEQQIGLDSIGPDLFRNRFNQGNVYHALFGGQVVAQAVAAANLTKPEGRSLHSCHAYFLRGGVDGQPVDFAVTRVRDGSRFSTRHVSASQGGKELLSLDCSYRVPLSGYEHQVPPTVNLDPDASMSETEVREKADPAIRELLEGFLTYYPMEVRIPSFTNFSTQGTETKRHYWLRSRFPIESDDRDVHDTVFAYLSDFMLVGVPLAIHTTALPGPHVTIASLDHSIWFHRPMRADDWLLFETDSPNARAGVNLARALVYDRQGNLVASLAQEGLQLPTGQPAPGT